MDPRSARGKPTYLAVQTMELESFGFAPVLRKNRILSFFSHLSDRL